MVFVGAAAALAKTGIPRSARTPDLPCWQTCFRPGSNLGYSTPCRRWHPSGQLPFDAPRLGSPATQSVFNKFSRLIAVRGSLGPKTGSVALARHLNTDQSPLKRCFHDPILFILCR